MKMNLFSGACLLLLIQYSTGADPGFFLGGGALVSCSTSTPINHIVFFWQNTSCIRKPQGGCVSPAPSPYIRPCSSLVHRTVGSSNPSAFSMLYKSLVRLVLEYVTPVWNPQLSKDVLALQKVQLRASGLALGQKRVGWNTKIV